MLDYAEVEEPEDSSPTSIPVLPFSQNPAWLVSPKDHPNRQYANLGVRAFQDWLIETLVAFHDRFGLGGYSFDHTFLAYPGTSRYAQWSGWRRVMEELRRRVPDIVIDGRQAYHLYGPWGWLAGSYPHPTFNDEQPESFVPFPDLHFDRVSADRERYTAYRYRNYEFAPSELVPGFITHQTSRGDDTGEMPEKKTDKRRHAAAVPAARLGLPGLALLAAVVDRDRGLEQRDRHDPRARSGGARRLLGEDQAWFRELDRLDGREQGDAAEHADDPRPARRSGRWTARRPIAGDRGFIFLFNPNGRRLNGDLPSRRVDRAGCAGPRRFVLRGAVPARGPPGRQAAATPWPAGDEAVDPHRRRLRDGARAAASAEKPAAPQLFNVEGTAALDAEC